METLPPANLCVLPFMHLGSKPDGEARICCFADTVLKDGQKNPIRFGKTSLEEIWNCLEIKKIRQQMLNNKKLKTCRACWDEERVGKKSKRLLENKRFLKKARPLFEEAEKNGGHIRQLPSYLDLRLGNLCNLKCRTCNPLFSSAWHQELERHREDFPKNDPMLRDSLYANFKPKSRVSGWYKTDSFFETIRKAAGNLKVLYISGGEPVLMKEWADILGHFIKTGENRHIALRLNSNITKLPELFMEKLIQFPDVKFGASIDGVKKRNDWLRSPSKWPQIAQNMERLMEISKKHKNIWPYIHCTISAFNALYIKEMIDYAKSLSEKFQTKDPHVSFNILRQPSYQSLPVLPKSLKLKAIERLNQLLSEGEEGGCRREDGGWRGLLPEEKAGAKAVILILESSMEDNEEIIDLRDRLRKHTLLIDRFRKEDFFSVFSEFQGRL